MYDNLKPTNTEYKMMYFSVNKEPLFASHAQPQGTQKQKEEWPWLGKYPPRSVNGLLESCSSGYQVRMRKRGKWPRRTVARTHPFQPQRNYIAIIQYDL